MVAESYVTINMSAEYEIARSAVKKFMLEEREKYGVLDAGGGVMDAHTMCIGRDGVVDIIPLDILSDPVNLKKIWERMQDPIGFAFREWIYDWVFLYPKDNNLSEWFIVALPGRDHDMYRARALAEKAVQCDFGFENAKVIELGG
jgi:hypothetical protein